jgi:hypothetical protein
MYFCRFTNIIILFQEALQFKATIVLYYNRQTTMRVTNCVPSPLTWHTQIIVDVLSLVVSVYVLN